MNTKKIAVLLCGSGYKDGSEIHESVATLWALSHYPHLEVQCFAPDLPQTEVVNCLTGKPTISESRNMLVEAARIARGKIKPLSDLLKPEHLDSYQALVLPGGSGAAKNFCTYASAGAQAQVLPDFEKVVLHFFEHKKWITAVCIMPVIVGLCLKGKTQATLTPGSLLMNTEAAKDLQTWGHHAVECAANTCVIDSKNKIISTPAYMHSDAILIELFEGVKNAITALTEQMTHR